MCGGAIGYLSCSARSRPVHAFAIHDSEDDSSRAHDLLVHANSIIYSISRIVSHTTMDAVSTPTNQNDETRTPSLYNLALAASKSSPFLLVSLISFTPPTLQLISSFPSLLPAFHLHLFSF